MAKRPKSKHWTVTYETKTRHTRGNFRSLHELCNWLNDHITQLSYRDYYNLKTRGHCLVPSESHPLGDTDALFITVTFT